MCIRDRDTTWTDVRVRPEAYLFVPNAFTPNGDGKNDLFYLQGEGILDGSYTIRIFNRWGEEIFFSNDTENSWDGTCKGKPAALGAYIYIIEFLDWESHRHTMKGSVNIYR
jgi:gliding motility-associated-like protein